MFDTETVGKINNNNVVDLSYLIVNKKGYVVLEQKSYLIKEFITNKITKKYYNEKTIKNIAIEEFGVIKQEFINLVNEYQIEKIYGFNCNFDKRALNNTNLNLLLEKNFFIDTVEIIDIKPLADKHIISKKSYIQFCIKNQFFTTGYNLRTDLETIYRFISKNSFYNQEHTGLKDIYITLEVLKYIFKEEKNNNR
ncbi:MAG: hypothetical protein HUJ97_09030, partial [Bacteroidales bacterium]|nr:hypothetical protein [Bacteroidales bacterium]